MPEMTLTIRSPVGLHARPAALFVRAATAFGDTKVELLKDGKVRDAKSIIQVLTLGVGSGASVVVRAEGPQAEEALEVLRRLVDDDFGE
ncbi:MAG: HPr family phosphocarrier protein [Candidatus Dormibacteraceae bacterium]